MKKSIGTLILLVSITGLLSGCNYFPKTTEGLKTDIDKNAQQVQKAADEVKQQYDSTKADIEKSITETQKAMDAKLNQLEDAGKKINEAGAAVSDIIK